MARSQYYVLKIIYALFDTHLIYIVIYTGPILEIKGMHAIFQKKGKQY